MFPAHESDRGGQGTSKLAMLLAVSMLHAVRVLATLMLGVLLLGCGKREAADPRDVLGDEMTYGGVDGRTGEPTAPGKGKSGSDEPADTDECEAAAEHLVALGIDLAIQQEQDPQKKQQLQADRERALASAGARKLAQQWTQECLDRGDTRAEVRCILKATREADLERCAAGE